MRIANQLPNINPIATPRVAQDGKQSFSHALQGALHEVNNQLLQSDQASELLVRGEIDFHNAMITAEKANLALQLTTSIRNKIIEAYQEIMRMQV